MSEVGTGKSVKTLSREFLRDRLDVDAQEKRDYKLLYTEHELLIGVRKVAQTLHTLLADSSKPVVLLGVLKGCLMFLTDLMRQLSIPYRVHLVSASSYHDKQTQHETVSISLQVAPETLVGCKVVVVDELADNGKTLFEVVQFLKSKEVPADDILTCVLLRKRKDEDLYPRPDIVGLDNVPNLWLVGYGLDRNNELRGWPVLYAVPKIAGVPREEGDRMFEEGEDGETYRKVRAEIERDVAEVAASLGME